MLFVLLLLVQSTNVIVGEGPLCFVCDDMSKAHFCDKIAKCKDGQLCYVERHVTALGYAHYSSGCSDVQECENGTSIMTTINPHQSVNRTCVECCHGDFCNNKGCGDSGLPSRNVRGPMCFKCNYLSDPRECDRLTVCSKTQDCALLEREWILFEKQYELGCKQGCNAVTSDHPSSQNETCCAKDFCNSPLSIKHLVNGSWSDWTPWSQCNATCDGHRSRQRTCTNPAPSGGGYACVGQSTEIEDCATCADTCPPNFTYEAKFRLCYKIAYVNLSFDAGRTYCQRHGADLIVFKSRAELQIIRNALQSVTNAIFYVGFHSVGQSSTYEWINGDPLPVTLYTQGGLWGTTGRESSSTAGCIYDGSSFWLEDCSPDSHPYVGFYTLGLVCGKHI